jgi:hypothetical protein
LEGLNARSPVSPGCDDDKDFARFKGLTVENWSKRHVRPKTEPY